MPNFSGSFIRCTFYTSKYYRMFKKSYLKIPIELLVYSNTNKAHKALGVYLLLKAACDGHLLLSIEGKREMMKALQIKTETSFNRYLARLVQLNWVGRDSNTNTYYVRSFQYLRKMYGFQSSESVCFYINKDSATIREFIQGALINSVMRRMIHGRRAVITKLAGRSALQKEGAIQELIAAGTITAYCGLANAIIGKILGVSKSQADRVKQKLVRLKYIRKRAKYNQITKVTGQNWTLYGHLPQKRRYKFRKRGKGENRYMIVYERTYDEIIPCMEFVKQKRITKKQNMSLQGAGRVLG